MDDPVEVLERWTRSGATWRVLERGAGTITVGLYTCDGGEEMSRISSADPALLAFVGRRDSSED